EKYCHIHDYGNHKTNECEIVKLVESKGWVRKNKKVEREEFNKRKTNYYMLHSSISTVTDNPFKLSSTIEGKPVKILIDTGADISIMPTSIRVDKTEMKPCTLTVNSASGGELGIIGQYAEIELKILDETIQPTLYVARNLRSDYILLGKDFLLKNKKWSLEILEMILTNKSKKGSHPENMRCVKCVSTFGETYQVEIDGIKEKYKDCFAQDLEGTPPCRITKHRIRTKEKYPLAQKNCPMPIHWEEEIEREVQKLIKNKIIGPSTSPWAARLIPVRKKDGNLRLCVDYRQLNEVTIRDQYPLPRIDQVLDTLASIRFFTTLDATSGYHKLEIDERDRKKTAFRYKNGLY
ncbi:MAG: reverse transcriptase family protein, partial [Aeromonas sp.]